MATADTNPTLRTLIPFWLPLAFMWLAMGIEQPVISAIVSRLPNPKVSLASFEVTMSIAMLLQSPGMHMLSAATAVARGVRSFAHLHALLTRIVIVLSGVHAIVCIPPVFRLIAEGILRVPPELTEPANLSTLILLPVTAGVGFRRLYQGAMIRAGRTTDVSLVMVIRLAVTAALLASALLLPPAHRPAGHLVAATAFTGGIVAGWFAAWHLFRTRVQATLDPDEADAWNLRRMTAFYLPLALTSVIVMTSRPLMAFAIGRAEEPLTSLAAWPVVQGFLFIFTAVAHSMQEVVIAHTRPDRPALDPQVRLLGLLVAGALSAAFLGSWFTGVTDWWYRVVTDAPEEIYALAYPATIVLFPLMAMGVVNSINSGMLVGRRATRFITLATAANVAVQITMALVIPTLVSIDGARLGASILVTSVSIQAVVLFIGARRR